MFLEFEDGAAASLVYGGYDFFDSDELHFWINERGAPKLPDQHGAARRALAASRPKKRACASNVTPMGRTAGPPPNHQPHFGLMVVTCARGEMRASADGLFIYDANGRREVALPKAPPCPAAAKCSTT